jgi:hypothetical protein
LIFTKKEAALMQIFLGFFDFYKKRSVSDANFFGIFRVLRVFWGQFWVKNGIFCPFLLYFLGKILKKVGFIKSF